jgi:hypothetical protein
MQYKVGKAIEWNPLDESASSYYLGSLIFGKEQFKIREMAKSQRSSSTTLKVSKVCQETKSITLVPV